jgi:hypothetical protein
MQVVRQHSSRLTALSRLRSLVSADSVVGRSKVGTGRWSSAPTGATVVLFIIVRFSFGSVVISIVRGRVVTKMHMRARWFASGAKGSDGLLVGLGLVQGQAPPNHPVIVEETKQVAAPASRARSAPRQRPSPRPKSCSAPRQTGRVRGLARSSDRFPVPQRAYTQIMP